MAAWQDGGESGMVDQTQAGAAHWERANVLQGKVREAERTHGFNSPQAKDLHRQASEARAAALDAGFRMTGQGEKIPGLDRRTSR